MAYPLDYLSFSRYILVLESCECLNCRLPGDHVVACPSSRSKWLKHDNFSWNKEVTHVICQKTVTRSRKNILMIYWKKKTTTRNRSQFNINIKKNQNSIFSMQKCYRWCKQRDICEASGTKYFYPQDFWVWECNSGSRARLWFS